jgi:hypothetical protein
MAYQRCPAIIILLRPQRARAGAVTRAPSHPRPSQAYRRGARHLSSLLARGRPPIRGGKKVAEYAYFLLIFCSTHAPSGPHPPVGGPCAVVLGGAADTGQSSIDADTQYAHVLFSPGQDGGGRRRRRHRRGGCRVPRSPRLPRVDMRGVGPERRGQLGRAAQCAVDGERARSGEPPPAAALAPTVRLGRQMATLAFETCVCDQSDETPTLLGTSTPIQPLGSTMACTAPTTTWSTSATPSCRYAHVQSRHVQQRTAQSTAGHASPPLQVG